MAKYISRAKRLGTTIETLHDALNILQSITDDYRDMIEADDFDKELIFVDVAQPLVDIFNKALEQIDSSEVEALAEEMGSWRDNMSGTSLEFTGKFDEVSTAADTLENNSSELQSIDSITINKDDTFDDILSNFKDTIDNIENIISELESVEFPGMY